MTTIKEKLSRGINPPNMLQSMASGYRREALAEIERLEKVIDELRAENARLALIVADHEMADYKSQVEELKAKLAAYEKKYNPAPVYTSNCIRHPGAPHGVDVDASWRAGHTVCICQSWAPGDAS